VRGATGAANRPTPRALRGKAKALGGQAAQGHKANANLADAFTKDATKKTRQSERSVQRDATRAKKVAVLPDIAGTSLDKGGRSIKPGAEEVPKWSMWLITSGRLLFTQ
jgi:hypothetical protein